MRNSLIEQIQSEPLRSPEGEPWPTEVLLFTQLPVAETLEMQAAMALRLTRGEAQHHQLVMLEHPPTLLIDPQDDDSVFDEAACREQGVEIASLEAHEGAATGSLEYRGPGQLAVYLTVKLSEWTGDLKALRTALAKIVLNTLADFQIQASLTGDGSAFVTSGRVIATLHAAEFDGVALGGFTIHTNTDADAAAALGVADAAPIIAMAELGLDVARQEEVREAVLRHAEEILATRLHLPQRQEINALRTTKPPWLKAKAPFGPGTEQVREIIGSKHLHTVCESARCPNLGECWKYGTATFMINGDVCSRSCSFCAVLTGRPLKIDADEPRRVAEAAVQMNLKYVVVTAVNRDDLPDGGAAQFVQTIAALRQAIPGVRVEVLIPDFKGVETALDSVFAARPDVLNHNIETVPRLYSRVRPQAKYQRSLDALKRAHDAGLVTKSGLMLGLGEESAEIDQTLQDWRAHGVQIVTIGQYLRPSEKHHPVVRYVTPAEFDHWRARGEELGFSTVESGALVRSSYHAHQSYGRHTHGNG